MISLDRRLKKLEKVIKSRYTHHGAFLVFIENDICTISNEEKEIGNCFNSIEELEDYICNKYECEKYVFLTFDYDVMGLSNNKK